MTPGYYLTIHTTDQDLQARLDSDGNYYVFLCDINDNPPIFPQSSYSIEFSESLNVLDTVFTLSKIDADLGSFCPGLDTALTDYNYLLNISILSGNSTAFSTDNARQAITLASEFDFETVSNKNFFLRIEVDDLAEPMQTDTADLYLTLTDANDNAPVFRQLSYNATIDEGLRTAAEVIVRVEADDADSSLNGDVRYRITSGNDMGIFAVVANNGDVTTNGSRVLDADPMDVVHILTVEAYDRGTTPQRTDITVTITVRNTNDNTPMFTDVNGVIISTDSVSVDEDVPINTLVYQSRATDLDGDLLYYRIADDPSNSFTIGGISGAVYTSAQSYCMDASYARVITIEVRDRLGQDFRAINLTLTINFSDVNLFAPAFCPPEYFITGPATVASGAKVGMLEAFDEDKCNTGFTYTISGGTDMSLFTLEASTGDLRAVNSISFIPGSEYEIEVTVADVGSVISSSSTSTVRIVLSQFAPFELEISNGYFTSLPTHDVSTLTQESNLFTSITRDQFGSISARLGTLSEQYTLRHENEQAADYKLDLIREDVYYDAFTLPVAIQRRTALKGVDITDSTPVMLSSTDGSTPMSVSDMISSSNGIKIVDFNVPLSWFTSASTPFMADLDMNFNSLGVNTVAQFKVNPFYTLPSIDTSVGNLILRLPQRTLFPGESFDINVYGEAVGEDLVSVDFSVTTNSSVIEFLSVAPVTGWSGSFSSSGNTANIGAFRADSSISISGNLYMTISARVGSTISASQVAALISYSITQISSATESGVPLAPTRVVISRTGIADQGTLYFSRPYVSAVYAVANPPHVINTAKLTNTPVTLSYSAYAVVDGTNPFVSLNTLVTSCAGTSGVFDISDPNNCNAKLTAASNPTLSLEELTLTVTVNGVEGDKTDVASYRIWTPSLNDLILDVTDRTLSVIDNYEHERAGTCLEIYQDADIFATTSFQYPTGPSVTARVEHLIIDDITFTPTDTLSRVGTNIRGLRAGTTTLSFQGKSVTVTTETTTVTIDRLHVIAATGITFTPPTPNPYGVNDPQSVTVGYEQILNRPETDAEMVAFAKFSDGKYKILDTTDGIEFGVSDSDFAEVTGSTLSIKKEGVGCLLKATLFPLDSCSATQVASGTGFISVEFDEPLDVIVTLSETEIVHSSDEANGLLSISTVISVTLMYGDGLTIDMTSDARTRYTFDNSRLSLIQTNCGSNCEAFSAANLMDSGVATIRVSFTHITSFREIDVNVYKSNLLEFSFAHYPDFSGSVSVDVFPLNLIENSGLYQKASVSLALNLVSGANTISRDISTQSSVAFQSSDTSILTISNRILSPSVDGTVRLTATFGSLSVGYQIIIVSTPARVVDITASFASGGDTLSGQIDQSADRLRLDVMFNDGTKYEDIFATGVNALPNVLGFTSTDFFDLDSTTGEATIRDNSPNKISHTINSISYSETFEFYTNLEASNGDLDLGKETQLPIAIATNTNSFSVPLRINSGKNSDGSKRGLSGVSGSISYDETIFSVTGFSKVSSWPGTILDVNIDSDPGIVTFSAPLREAESAAFLSISSDAVEIFTLTMNYKNVPTSSLQTQVRTFIEDMLDDSIPPNTTQSSNDATAGTFYIGSNPQGRTRRSLPQTDENPLEKRRPRGTTNCAGGPLPPGDANGDCNFNVADVTYTLNYVVERAASFPTPGDYYSSATPQQLSEMDPTLDKAIDSNDARYLNRIIVNLLPFVRDVTILSPHEYAIGSQCRIKVEARIVDKDNSPVTTGANFYAGFFTPSSVFGGEIANLYPDSGFGAQVPSTDTDPTFHGQFYRTEYSGDMSRLQLRPYFNNQYDDIAVILAVATTTNTGTTGSDRIATFFGPNTSPTQFTNTFEKTINDGSVAVLVRKTSRFNPFKAITVNLTFEMCNNIGSPNFDQPNYAGQVFENVTSPFVVLTVSATDPDNLTNAEIVFSLQSAAVDSDFVINGTSGEISVNQTLDRERRETYDFTVIATDKGVSQVLSGEVNVTITVLDVNDNDPMFSQDFYGNFSFPENDVVSRNVLTVSASDRDIGNNGAIDYSLDKDCRSYFTVSSSGVIQIALSIDFEDVQSFVCTVIATDRGYEPRSSTAYFNVDFIPINDLGPECPATVVLAFAFNAPMGHVIGIITAQDGDLGNVGHDLLSYNLVDTAGDQFSINKISNNQVELKTVQTVFATGDQFSVTLNVTDDVLHYCVSQITLFVQELSYFDFDFDVPKIGFFKEIPKFNFVEESYDQIAGFFVEGRDTTNFNAVASRGPQTRSTPITKVPQTATAVSGVIRGENKTYFDNPKITVTAQFKSASGSTYLSQPNAMLRLISTTRVLTANAVICTSAMLTDGICTGVLTLTPDWFTTSDTANVAVMLDGTLFLIGSVMIVQKPTLPVRPTENFVITVPHYGIFEGDEFEVEISAFTRYEPVGYQFEITYDTAIVSYLSTVFTSGWVCSPSVVTDKVSYSCNLQNTNDIPSGTVDKYTDLLTARFRLVSTSPPSSFTIQGRGRALTGNNAVIYSTGAGSPNRIHQYDRDGFLTASFPHSPNSSNAEPMVYVEEDRQLIVYGIVEDSELLNDLRILDITEKIIDAGIALKAVPRNPSSALTDLPLSGFTCTSSDLTVLRTSTTGCMLMFVAGASGTTVPSESVTVEINQGATLIASINFRVWTPKLIGSDYALIELNDENLQNISTCSNRYQQARVNIRATFESSLSSATPIQAYYADYSDMTFQIDIPGVSFSNGIISVNSTFSGTTRTTVTFRLRNAGQTVATKQFTVDPVDTVTLEIIKPEVFTEMSVTSLPPDISILSQDQLTLRGKLSQNCNTDKQPNYVTTKAVFSDGTTQILDGMASELTINPYAPVLRNSGPLTLEAYGSGTGQVQVCWKCPVADDTCGEVSVTCNIPSPTAQLLQVDAGIIAYQGSIANLAGIPSISRITTISLFYGSEESDLRFDPRTNITLIDPLNLFVLNSTALTISPNTNTGFGTATLRITFSQAPTVVLERPILLAVAEGLAIQLAPYPAYPDSSSQSDGIVLEKISGTGVFERATVMTTLMTREQTTSPDISNLVAYTTTPNDIVTITGTRITPIKSGIAELTAEFNGLSAQVSINVTDVEVRVLSIDLFQLPSNTLNVPINQSVPLTLDLTLTDGTRILNFFGDAYYRPQTLITFNTSSQVTAIEVNNDGEVIIRENHHGLVSLNAISGSVLEMTSFAVNLNPNIGDFDLGQRTGIPIGPLSPGDLVTVPIRFNAGTNGLSAFHIEVMFDEAVFMATGVAQILGDVTVEIGFNIPNRTNIYNFVGVFNDPILNLQDFGQFQLMVKSDAPSTIASISLFRVILEDESNGLIEDKLSEAGDIPVQINGRSRRSSEEGTRKLFRRTTPATPGNLPCGNLGDANNDGNFNVLDARATRDMTVSSPNNYIANLDVNRDTILDINDVLYMIRGLALSLPFHCHTAVTMVSSTSCKLKITVELRNADNTPPLQDYTFPIVLIQHRYFSISNDWAASNVTTGYKSSPTPGPIRPIGGLWESTPSTQSPGIYEIEIDTAISAEEIGLTVLLMTANSQFMSSRSRFTSIYKANSRFNFEQIPNFDIVSIRDPRVSHSDSFIGASGGFDPLLSFNNPLRSDLCRFSDTVTRLEIIELSEPDTVVGKVGALTLGGSLGTYSITLLEPATPYFRTDNLNGVENIVVAFLLDAEVARIISFYVDATVNVYDIDGAMTSTQTRRGLFNISIIDENDNAPVFRITEESFVLPENIAVNTVLFRYFADDADVGTNGLITYRISRGLGREDFYMNATTGDLSVARSLDRENRFAYQLEIIAEDSALTARLSADFNCTITLEDINDNAPVIRTPPGPFEINENLPPLRALSGTFVAEDIDNSDNGTIMEIKIVEVRSMNGVVELDTFLLAFITQVSYFYFVIKLLFLFVFQCIRYMFMLANLFI